MKDSQIISALQDLIIRLQDAERGYKEIALATSNKPMKDWLMRYSKERHDMHKILERQVATLGGDANVKTSFLGDLHRLFIDLKINTVGYDNEYDAILKEIKRGSSALMEDYNKVITEVAMPDQMRKLLMSQKAFVKAEVDQLKYLKDELLAVEAS